MFVPPQTPDDLARGAVVEGLAACGIDATWLDGKRIDVDGEILNLELVPRAHPTSTDLQALGPAGPQGLLMVVADRLSDAARATLRERGIGWLDRRGSLRLWSPRLKLDLGFTPARVGPDRRAPKAFTAAVRDVAMAILLTPDAEPSPRALGRLTDRSPGYASTILSGLREDGLVQGDGRPLTPDLFWALADAWDVEWCFLDDSLDRARGDGGAVPTATAGAAAWGAPPALGGDAPISLIVATASELRRLQTRSATPLDAVKSAVRHEPNFGVYVIDSPAMDAPIAHPLICALDLAETQGGREAVSRWTPRHADLSGLGALEVYRQGWVQVNWLADIFRTPRPDGLWAAAIAAAWHHDNELGFLYQHPDTPEALRRAVRARIAELTHNADERTLRALARHAPVLSLEEPFNSHDLSTASDGLRDYVEGLRAEVEAGFVRGEPDSAVSSAAKRWLTQQQQNTDPWAVTAGAHYLLGLRSHAHIDEETLQHLREIVGRPWPESLHTGSDPWSEWSSGDRPWWYELCDDVRSVSDRTSLASVRRLLARCLNANIDGRAMPIAELLPRLEATDLDNAVDAIAGSAPAVADLHIRAKVLAVAAKHAKPADRDILRHDATMAARAAVEQQAGSLLGGSEPGGIRGYLEVAALSEGPERKDVLAEATEGWLHWVGAFEKAPKRQPPDHRILFDGGGDTARPLLAMLAQAEMVDQLQRMFTGIRDIADRGNDPLRFLIPSIAWPALRGGSLELAGLLVGEMRDISASGARSSRSRSSMHHAGKESTGSDPPPFPDYPNVLVGFRCAWH